jgi:hypothetical protein
MFEFDGINKLYTFLQRVSRIPGLEFLRSDATRLVQSQAEFYDKFDGIEGGIEGGEDGLRAIGEAIVVTKPGHGNSHHQGGEQQGGSPQHASGERPVVMKSTYAGESTSWSGKKTSGGAGSSRRAPKTNEELRAQKKLLMKKLRG